MDIVEQLSQGAYSDALDNELMQRAAATIKVLRAEIDHLGKSLDACHAKLLRATCPVWDTRNSEEPV